MDRLAHVVQLRSRVTDQEKLIAAQAAQVANLSSEGREAAATAARALLPLMEETLRVMRERLAMAEAEATILGLLQGLSDAPP